MHVRPRKVFLNLLEQKTSTAMEPTITLTESQLTSLIDQAIRSIKLKAECCGDQLEISMIYKDEVIDEVTIYGPVRSYTCKTDKYGQSYYVGQKGVIFGD